VSKTDQPFETGQGLEIFFNPRLTRWSYLLKGTITGFVSCWHTSAYQYNIYETIGYLPLQHWSFAVHHSRPNHYLCSPKTKSINL